MFNMFRYDDIGTLVIPRTCPSQINETGKHKFRARAFYEAYPQYDSWGFTPPTYMAELEAVVSFSNGSTWSGILIQ